MSDSLSWRIVRRFAQQNRFGFCFQDVMKEFPEKHKDHLSRTCSEMVKQGRLFKIAHDAYHIVPIHEEASKYVPDMRHLAKYIMQGKDYYIALNSALQIHGIRNCTEERNLQDFFIACKSSMRPSRRILGNHKLHVMLFNNSRFFGHEEVWINRHEKACVSELEKTIVDIASHLKRCGGVFVLAEALAQLEGRVNQDKLYHYFARNGSKAAIRRFLFLSDLLGLNWTSDHDHLLALIGSGYSLLDPTMPDKGKKLSRFGIRLNVDPEKIITKVLMP